MIISLILHTLYGKKTGGHRIYFHHPADRRYRLGADHTCYAPAHFRFKKYFNYNKNEEGQLLSTVECMTCHHGKEHPGK